jgi:hypothetical protein
VARRRPGGSLLVFQRRHDVGRPGRTTDFFSDEGKGNLRGRWNNWKGQPEEEISFFGSNKLRGAEMLGYTREHFFSSDHAIYPMLRPAMEELFAKFQPAFLDNAAYHLRNRKQFWPISAHNHLLLKSNRARVLKPQNSAHFSNRYCLTATPDALEARLQQLMDDTMAYGLHQLPRGSRGQSAERDELSIAGDRAGSILRETVPRDLLTAYFMLWMIESTLVAPSAGLDLPKSTSVATGVNSLLKPEALGGVTWGGGTSSDAIDCEKSSAILACGSSNGATSFCTAGIAGMPRSVVSTLVAAGSVSKKSISLALASGCFERDDADQYMDALSTIFGDSPFA